MDVRSAQTSTRARARPTMAARKLQTEIDRTLKKVSEGVELFESIYDKMQASTNQTQKEKLETDLKTQIKKLQRLRDQIKTWVSGNDIKDKTALLENRRLIETQMEKFKACEKEMKTKAFSKEGLIQSARLDPAEQKKLETTQWLQSSVEELQMQVESAEAEIETLQGTGRKKSKQGAAAERLEELERLNERRKWHISRLEIILRLLDNGTLTTDRVLALQEDVKYFVEDNASEDFDEDEMIYDELRLDEEEEKFGKLAHEDDESDLVSEADLPPRTPKKATHSNHHKDDEEDSVKRSRDKKDERGDESPILKKAGATLQMRKHSTASEARPAPPPPNPNFGQAPMASVLKAGLPKPAAPTLPPLKYAAAAAGASSSSIAASASATPATPSRQAPPTKEKEASVSREEMASVATTSPSLTHATTTSPFMSSASVALADGSMDSPAISEAVPSTSPSRATPASPEVSKVDAPAPISAPSSAAAPAPAPSSQAAPSALQPTTAPAAPVALASASPAPAAPLASSSSSPAPAPLSSATPARQPEYPAMLGDLVSSFEAVKQKAPARMADVNGLHKFLNSSYASMPTAQDTEKPKYYVPRNPYQSPAYYPQQPLRLLSSPQLFAQLDVETLFYVFYYLPGTYQQYLAAKELKRQSWRFHVKYLTWFQRHSEPQAITDEYEQGVYVYFDWEGSWCQRKKSDFRFEYRYLSED
ncbi:unnamed protein product [Peniophora sp. CBMAI 1063]|nr:unnamed protein product [Peniophora sp. CBMAI 1063]